MGLASGGSRSSWGPDAELAAAGRMHHDRVLYHSHTVTATPTVGGRVGAAMNSLESSADLVRGAYMERTPSQAELVSDSAREQPVMGAGKR